MRTPIPEQEPKKRAGNFDEVCLGYLPEQAIQEASRCLNCKDPRCVKKCPVNVDIPGFILKIKENDIDGALEVIKKTNNLPGVCGRVCPQEKQCEFGCILNLKNESVAIGKLERFAADNGKPKQIKKPKQNKKKIAVIGSGPAGLACASDLNQLGYSVTIFEALHEAGGVLTYGIPEFRLPKKIVKQEIEAIQKQGVEIKKNYVIGKTLTIDELKSNFDAVFIASGAGLPYFMGIPGEGLVGVYSANEFLTRINLMHAKQFPNSDTPVKTGKKTFVVGCGNVAIDAARSAKRLGSEVIIIYRRTIVEAPARQEEIKHAQEEGIHFMFLTSPKRILGEGKVEGVELIQMMLEEDEESGRRKPVPIENSEFKMECDQVIMAIGQGPNPILTKEGEMEMNSKGKLIVDSMLRTSQSPLFAGGDIVEGEATVIKAMGDGKKAAEAIHNFLTR
jgi:glutamate synthase (NADPH) small chain